MRTTRVRLRNSATEFTLNALELTAPRLGPERAVGRAYPRIPRRHSVAPLFHPLGRERPAQTNPGTESTRRWPFMPGPHEFLSCLTRFANATFYPRLSANRPEILLARAPRIGFPA